MSEDSFILMNLKDSKDIAAAMQNVTAQKILDFLTKGKATESEIAKALGIPMSTVHYNIQQLKKAKLVKADEYTYSKKGKEILHYKLAKKLIIIAPAGEESNWKELIKKIVPALGITAIIGWLVQKLSLSSNNLAAGGMQETAIAAAPRMFEDGGEEAMLAADSAMKTIPGSPVPGFWETLNSFEWFILGAVCIIGMLLIMELFASKQWFKSKKHSE